jgi:hypothetical protein
VIIDQLVAGAKKNLLAAGVLEENITVQTESVLAGASLQGLLFAFTIVGLGSAGAFDSSHFVKT